MSEIVFQVEEAPEGGFTARALGASTFAEADDLASLHATVRDAVRCHFEPDRLPSEIVLLVEAASVGRQPRPWRTGQPGPEAPTGESGSGAPATGAARREAAKVDYP